MKFGILPAFVRGKITDPDWCAEFLEIIEAEGCESVWTVEHVIVAEEYEPLYPYSEDGRMPGGAEQGTVMPDPLEWLSFAAGLTHNLLLGTSVVVASQHSAAILAKRVATLDALSGGRVRLGVGLGWQKEEYAAIGVPYSDRGRRLDECIEAMRALWAPGPATYRGKYVSFDRVHCDTKPAQEAGVPILIGGSSEAAARRAGRLGDGFFPYVISPDDLALRVRDIEVAADEIGRDARAIGVTVWPGSYQYGCALDLDMAKRYVDAGVTRLVISAQEAAGPELDDIRRFVADYRDQIAAKL